MKLNDLELARLMLDQARRLAELVRGRQSSDLEANSDFAAIVAWRLLEVANRAVDVSVEAQAQCPDLPWREFQGLRKMLLHGQQALDTEIVWKVVAEDIPALLPKLEAFADGLPAPGGAEIIAVDRFRKP